MAPEPFSRGRARFEGWYCKHQNETDTISFIPAFHVDEFGQKSASIQVITNSSSWFAEYPEGEFELNRRPFCARIGDSMFSELGADVHINIKGLKLSGTLEYGDMVRPESDIMGPFRFVPFMQCRHGILSLCHEVNGKLMINGRTLAFKNGRGYIETDRGRSFPSEYAWTQCSWGDSPPAGLMLAVADIPFGGGSFMGCIGSVYYRGREYRLATYRLAKLLRFSEDEICVKQGNLALEVNLLGKNPQKLRAPDNGGLTRTIHESASCRVRYRFWVNERAVFDFVSDRASFEYVREKQGKSN